MQHLQFNINIIFIIILINNDSFIEWKLTMVILLQLVAKRVETLLTFEANFRHLDNYSVYPSLSPPYQCCVHR